MNKYNGFELKHIFAMEIVSSGAVSTGIEFQQQRRYALDRHGHKCKTIFPQVGCVLLNNKVDILRTCLRQHVLKIGG